MKFFKRYILSSTKLICFFLLSFLIFTVIFTLYKIPIGAVIYPTILCFCAGLVFIVFDYIKKYHVHRKLLEVKQLDAKLIANMPNTNNIIEHDYQMIIQTLKKKIYDLETTKNKQYSDMIDYYTLWAHQIKTPITSMKLALKIPTSNAKNNFQTNLHRIEQYVDMVLAFMRLNSKYSDYIFKEYSLDNIAKACIKKFSHDFISKKIKLNYVTINKLIITDKKWFSLVIEQLLSNALKYTKNGSIKIYFSNDNTLCIADTGIGIKPEDIPRIFDKGYTGYNGHNIRHSSGIGLYICKRICNDLKIKINVKSQYNVGTSIYLTFDQQKIIPI